MINNPIVLLVSHDAVNMAMLEFACGTLPSHPQCQNAYGTSEALSFIQDTKNPLADLVMIDLDTVGDNGLTLLETLKKDPATRLIPVLITAKTSTESTVKKAYDLGCVGFVIKPDGVKAWTHAMEVITAYWFTYGQVPKRRY